MNIVFSENAWKDYLSWQSEDKKILKKINGLIKDISKQAHEGLGKPEALKHDLAGYWSRRINQAHRLVYRVVDENIQIIACRFHYDK